MSLLLLTFPDTIGQTTIDTNAFDVLVGCVVLQQQPEYTTKHIVYWSRFLTNAERTYIATRRKSLAIAWTVLLLSFYSKGTHFTICTDHECLKQNLTTTDSTGRLAR